MLIWLDGVYGVGKTSVAEKIVEKLSKDAVIVLDADLYWQKNFNLSRFTAPQCDTDFIPFFYQIIKKHLNHNEKSIIVVMALTECECKQGLLEKLQGEGVEITHIILTATKEAIISRIEQGDEDSRIFRLMKLKWNLSFLERNYKDAVQIDTNGKSADMVAEEIVERYSF